MENIVYATKDNFDALIKDGTVLIDFYADWCGPCKMLSPILEQIAKEEPSLKIVKVDVDELQEIASKYEVMAMPTMKLLKGGQVVDQKVGYEDKDTLLTWIKSV